MKKTIFLLFSLLFAGNIALTAQTTLPAAQPVAAAPATQPRVGHFSYNSLLTAMPEYATAQEALAKLRQQYTDETLYNERNFKRMFAEFLQGQKDFPQNILLKRQLDLQTEMEKGIAFRNHCDSLMKQAEVDMLRPVRAKLNTAITAAGAARGYDFILNTDNDAVPYLRSGATEDAAPFIKEHLSQQP